MLTRHDRTIADAEAMLNLISPLKLRHIGFKDVGISAAALRKLVELIQHQGAETYVEMVTTSREEALKSARQAAEAGVQHLLGGTWVRETLAILRGLKTSYYPFPGFPQGHPTRLGGDARDIETHCREFVSQGCAGADLLAFRATSADPIELTRAARAGLGDKRLIVAGSVDSPERIASVAAAGADAFTVGSAVFAGTYVETAGSPLSQLEAIRLDAQRLIAPS